MQTMKKHPQVAKEFSVKADNKNKKFESYRIHWDQIKAKMRLIFKPYRRIFFLYKADYKLQ